jgi:hypothetical protein
MQSTIVIVDMIRYVLQTFITVRGVSPTIRGAPQQPFPEYTFLMMAVDPVTKCNS